MSPVCYHDDRSLVHSKTVPEDLMPLAAFSFFSFGCKHDPGFMTSYISKETKLKLENSSQN